jgi:hypothetical protein
MTEKRLKDLKTLYKKQSYRFDDNPEKYLKIKKDIEKNGFDYKVSKILISSDDYIIDGHHRHSILKSIYDDDYIINVIKMPINRITMLILWNIFFILTVPVLIPFFLIGKIMK